ncbi:MAG: hypothetical protein J6B81_05180 [Spirochaetaceae bacterium]|nr:hypothetical protein [Spirochaetaceae bacterium]
MEESTESRKNRFANRLLILFTFFLLLYFPCVAEDNTFLAVKPEVSWVYVGNECSFLLQIPQVTPSSVRTVIEQLPEGVRFVSSSKDEFVQDNQSGTKLRLWFSFSEPGEYNIPDLTVYIKGKKTKIPFESIIVYQNPLTLKPELKVQFFDENNNEILVSSGVVETTVAKPIKIKISLLYASYVLAINWHLQENALFNLEKQYDVVGSESGSLSFSQEAEPIAEFEWIALEVGEYSVPQVEVSAVSYNGTRVELKLVGFFLRAALAEEKTLNQNVIIPAALKEAFAYEFETVEDSGRKQEVVDRDKAVKLATLRAKERFSLPFSAVARERKLYETELALVSEKNEPSFVIVVVLAVTATLCVIFCIVLFFVKRNLFAVASVVLAVVLIVTCYAYSTPLRNDVGIFCGGIVRVVPEEKSQGSIPIPPLSYVKILEKTDTWYYIDVSGTGGWIPQNAVVVISRQLLTENPVQ